MYASGPDALGKAGDNMDDLLREAEAAVAELAASFTTWVQDDLASARKALDTAKQSPADNLGAVQEIFGICHNIKGQAGSFGYNLMTTIGGQLCDMIRDRSEPAGPELLKAVEAHLAALQFLAERGIDGDGGEIGQKLIVKLRQLSSKIA